MAQPTDADKRAATEALSRAARGENVDANTLTPAQRQAVADQASTFGSGS